MLNVYNKFKETSPVVLGVFLSNYSDIQDVTIFDATKSVINKLNSSTNVSKTGELNEYSYSNDDKINCGRESIFELLSNSKEEVYNAINFRCFDICHNDSNINLLGNEPMFLAYLNCFGNQFKSIEVVNANNNIIDANTKYNAERFYVIRYIAEFVPAEESIELYNDRCNKATVKWNNTEYSCNPTAKSPYIPLNVVNILFIGLYLALDFEVLAWIDTSSGNQDAKLINLGWYYPKYYTAWGNFSKDCVYMSRFCCGDNGFSVSRFLLMNLVNDEIISC